MNPVRWWKLQRAKERRWNAREKRWMRQDSKRILAAKSEAWAIWHRMPPGADKLAVHEVISVTSWRPPDYWEGIVRSLKS